MSELTQSNANELSDISAKGTDKSDYSKLVDVKPIEDTPFAVIKYEDEYFLAMGNYRISEKFKTFEEAENDIKDVSWNRLVSVMEIVFRTILSVKDSEIINNEKGV